MLDITLKDEQIKSRSLSRKFILFKPKVSLYKSVFTEL